MVQSVWNWLVVLCCDALHNRVLEQDLDGNDTRKITTAFSRVALFLGSAAAAHVTSLSSILYQQLRDVSLYLTLFNNSLGVRVKL
jgi:hypothetical protein